MELLKQIQPKTTKYNHSNGMFKAKTSKYNDNLAIFNQFKPK
jgi:hypothetical protein